MPTALTSCVLRSDRTESVWKPTDLVKFPVHSIRSMRKKLRHLAGRCHYFFLNYLIDIYVLCEPCQWGAGGWGWGWGWRGGGGRGVLSALAMHQNLRASGVLSVILKSI